MSRADSYLLLVLYQLYVTIFGGWFAGDDDFLVLICCHYWVLYGNKRGLRVIHENVNTGCFVQCFKFVQILVRLIPFTDVNAIISTDDFGRSIRNRNTTSMWLTGIMGFYFIDGDKLWWFDFL